MQQHFLRRLVRLASLIAILQPVALRAQDNELPVTVPLQTGSYSSVGPAVDERLSEEETRAVVPLMEDSEDRFTIDEAIAYALEHNYAIREAAARLEEAYGVSLEARSGQLPRADVAAGYSRLDKNRLPSFETNTPGTEGGSFGSDERWTSGLTIRQPLYTGGAAPARTRQGEIEREVANYSLESVRQAVVREVRERFYEVLLAHSRITVRRQSVSLLEEELSLERNRLQAGTVSDFNVIRAEAELSNARTPLIQARNELRIGLEDLGRILGLVHPAADSVVPFVKVAGELKDVPVVLDLPESIRQAELRRPDLKTAQLAEDAAKEGITIARADYWPQLSVRGGYAAESSQFSNRLDDVDHGWEVGADITWNIFNGWATEGRVVQARARKDQAAVSVARRKEEVRVEVRRALSRVVEAKELVAAAAKAIQQAEESFRLAKARAQVGAAPQIEVLDAQVALTDARTNFVQALFSLNLSLAELARATGEPIRPKGK